ncbi:hypothetical protein EYR36_011869 [Pleurotus pulmonarius]|nr:hypothetical protein EYR36_011869 [Pleurotus pulmonarius]
MRTAPDHLEFEVTVTAREIPQWKHAGRVNLPCAPAPSLAREILQRDRVRLAMWNVGAQHEVAVSSSTLLVCSQAESNAVDVVERWTKAVGRCCVVGAGRGIDVGRPSRTLDGGGETPQVRDEGEPKRHVLLSRARAREYNAAVVACQLGVGLPVHRGR